MCKKGGSVGGGWDKLGSLESQTGFGLVLFSCRRIETSSPRRLHRCTSLDTLPTPAPRPSGVTRERVVHSVFREGLPSRPLVRSRRLHVHTPRWNGVGGPPRPPCDPRTSPLDRSGQEVVSRSAAPSPRRWGSSPTSLPHRPFGPVLSSRSQSTWVLPVYGPGPFGRDHRSVRVHP